MFDYTWDEIIEWYKSLHAGGTDQRFRFQLVGCMLKILPILRQKIEEQELSIKLNISMLALELRLVNASGVIVVQCIEESQVRVTMADNNYQTLEENIVNISNAVKQTMRHLEIMNSTNRN